MQEIWKRIKGFNNYQVSNFGRVRFNRKKIKYKDGKIVKYKPYILKQRINSRGYYTVSLSSHQRNRTLFVHRLVAIAFIPIPQKYLDQGYTIDTLQVNHKDENKLNNCVDNLEWVTLKENINYGTGIERRSRIQSVKISMFTKEGKLERHFSSYKEIDKYFNKPGASKRIADVCNLKSKSLYGYVWRYYKPEYDLAGYILEDLPDFSDNGKGYCIAVYDEKSNVLLGIFKSKQDIMRTYHISRRVIKDNGTHNGYRFKILHKGRLLPIQMINKDNLDMDLNGREVCQIRPSDKKILAIYPSINYVCKKYGLFRESDLQYKILACCQNLLHAARKFQWKFKDTVNEEDLHDFVIHS